MNPSGTSIVKDIEQNPNRGPRPWRLIKTTPPMPGGIVGYSKSGCDIDPMRIVITRSHKMSLLSLRLYRAGVALADAVDVDPKRCGGVPVLKGTRITIAQIIAQIAEGDGVDTLVDEFEIDRSTVVKVLECLSDFLSKPLLT